MFPKRWGEKKRSLTWVSFTGGSAHEKAKDWLSIFLISCDRPSDKGGGRKFSWLNLHSGTQVAMGALSRCIGSPLRAKKCAQDVAESRTQSFSLQVFPLSSGRTYTKDHISVTISFLNFHTISQFTHWGKGEVRFDQGYLCIWKYHSDPH